MKNKEIRTVKELIKELKKYDGNTVIEVQAGDTWDYLCRVVKNDEHNNIRIIGG